MEATERRDCGVEVRREGRRLVGPALLYSDISPSHRERFEVGAFREDLKDTRTRWLDVSHRSREVIAWGPGGGGLTLSEDERGVHVVAEIPEIPAGNRALQDVALRALTGLSVEFVPVAQRSVPGELRVISEARLNGIGLVGAPSYPHSQVEVRARSGRSFRASIPTGKRLSCRCSGSGCKTASFSPKALGAAMGRAFKPGANTLAVRGNYASPLASVSRGTLRRSGATGVVVDLPDDEFGAAVLAASESSGTILRPILDPLTSKGVVELLPDGKNMAYNDPNALDIRAFDISSTDQSGGWPAPKIGKTSAARAEGWICL